MPSPINATWLAANSGIFTVVLARVLGLVWTAPAWSTSGLTWRYRLVLGLLLGMILIPAVGGQVTKPVEGPAFVLVCAAELVVGAGLGWSAALIVAGARQAGEIVGMQAGLSPAALFDPEAGDDLTPLGHLYGLIALGVFLALDGPLVLVRALVESYQIVPAGSALLTGEAVALTFGRVGQALELSLRAAAPVALALALAGIALGLLGRAAPSLPLVALSLPVRAVLGLLLVGLGMAALCATLSAAWGAWPGGW